MEILFIENKDALEYMKTLSLDCFENVVKTQHGEGFICTKTFNGFIALRQSKEEQATVARLLTKNLREFVIDHHLGKFSFGRPIWNKLFGHLNKNCTLKELVQIPSEKILLAPKIGIRSYFKLLRALKAHGIPVLLYPVGQNIPTTFQGMFRSSIALCQREFEHG